MFELRRAPHAAPRRGMIDSIRGFAVVNMVVIHALYDLFCVYSLNPGFFEHPLVILWERIFGFTFIILSGMCINFSHRGFRRGLIVLLGGLIITLLTLFFLPGELVWFGILHFLGCAILITFALKKPLGRLDPLWGAGVSLLLFAVLYGLPDGYLGFFGVKLAALPASLYNSAYLAFLGLPSAGFHSADYYPLLPWLFLYFFGFFLWRVIEGRGWDRSFNRGIPVLDFIGRHSLVIYLLHQPLLFGLFWLIFGSL